MQCGSNKLKPHSLLRSVHFDTEKNCTLKINITLRSKHEEPTSVPPEIPGTDQYKLFYYAPYINTLQHFFTG